MSESSAWLDGANVDYTVTRNGMVCADGRHSITGTPRSGQPADDQIRQNDRVGHFYFKYWPSRDS
jgi:hypothetical protein